MDLAAPVVTPSGKSTTQVLVHFNKNGFAYTFDRLTGEIISAPVFGPNPASVNWASDINLTTGLPTINPSKLTEPVGTVAQNICPSAMGLKGWEPSAYSPVTNYFYLPLFNLCMNYQGLQTEYVAGAPYMGIDMQIGLGTLPGTATAPYPMAELVAWDFATGQRAWSIAEARPIYGGVLATAGNVVFYTTLHNKFKAVHAANGQKLYETSLECSSVGSPVSFINAIDGKQRIAVFSGVSWLAGGFSLTGKPCPGRGGSAAVNGGGRVHIYKLP